MKKARIPEQISIGDCVMYGLISMIWYNNILFRCLPYATYEESKSILWVTTVGFGTVGMAMTLKKQCGMWMFARWLILTYGAYTVCAYAKTLTETFAAATGICLAVSIVYGLYLWMRVIRKRRRRRYISRYLNACSSIFAIGALTVMLMIGAGRVFGGNLINASVQKTEPGDLAQMMEDNMDTLAKLKEETWYGLSTMEKLNVLQTAANIQCVYLGLANDVRVGASNLPQHTLGEYTDDTRTISIDLSHLENNSVHDVLNTCFHEIYHSYQHLIADAYREAAPQMKELYLYRRAAEYAWEFDHYRNAKMDWELYSTQACESDSRTYAANMTETYFWYIDQYDLEHE